VNKILILSASFGEGHNAAARGIYDAVRQIAPAAEVEVRDIFAETYGSLNDLTCRAYLGVINRAPHAWAALYSWIDQQQDFRGKFRWLLPAQRRLAAMIERDRPDVLVAVYPSYAHLLDAEYGPAQGNRPKRVVVVTDSISVNAVWFRCPADFFLVPNDQTAGVLERSGLRPDLLRVFGFPVNPRFADASLRTIRSDGPPWRVLYMINAGKNSAPDLTRRLAAIPETELTITVGRDEKLRQKIQAVRAAAARTFEIIGWTSELPRLLSSHHILIGKAGGATVQETIAAGCPMIINQVVPGQEEGNAQLILETKTGALALSSDAVISTLKRAFADDGKLLREWSANIAEISRPDASLQIAKFLLEL
jgi:processive 1,2-diacylglycerol beta-glucosyltransferase